ncbi:DUF4272 domain-containing protein [Candidatus Marithioploca araucensis]|uniref:DUF4272 domain-containing protein n=1 Tax=Candidatus Marithioploca araucensis TaxID=70273 RepID=A0ABT7VRT0_9GAMM|nr:DUF4272 domain-containing protein [Candidatus Marithioploca araucensis]
MDPEKLKLKSHFFLKKHSIPINESLPLIETIDELSPQDSKSVAQRIIILNHVIGIGFDAYPKKLLNALIEFDLLNFASTQERSLLSKKKHTDQEKIDATWQIECVQSLAWCLGLVDFNPLNDCDDNLASHFPKPYCEPKDFIESVKLRRWDEIFEQADLHYRIHWAARDSRLKSAESPVQEGLISERRKALDWVIGVEQDWDEIPLDT